jgi:hypothetical protein
MWIVLILVGLIIFGFIRGIVISSGQFKVVNKKGIPFHYGSYNECKSYAKEQNQSCRALGIDDYFTVQKYRI